MEVCTAEKQMDRRTGCLQANVEFLQRALNKLSRETQDRWPPPIAILPPPAQIAALKSAVEKLNGELEQMKAKAETEGKK